MTLGVPYESSRIGKVVASTEVLQPLVNMVTGDAQFDTLEQVWPQWIGVVLCINVQLISGCLSQKQRT